MRKLTWAQFANRLEALSLREKVMLLVGLPVVLLVVGEAAIFSPGRSRADLATKQAEQSQVELKSLRTVLESQPALGQLPALDKLQAQRNELLRQLDAAGATVAQAKQRVDWGSVVRATAGETRGLVLTQLKTMAPELVFSPASVKPMATPATPATPANSAKAIINAAAALTSAASAAATLVPPPVAAIDSIYRHRAELAVKGEFGAVLGYLQSLQRVPGDLRWDKLQLGVAGYPQASAQLTLFTLSNRAETPFN